MNATSGANLVGISILTLAAVNVTLNVPQALTSTQILALVNATNNADLGLILTPTLANVSAMPNVNIQTLNSIWTLVHVSAVRCAHHSSSSTETPAHVNVPKSANLTLSSMLVNACANATRHVLLASA